MENGWLLVFPYPKKGENSVMTGDCRADIIGLARQLYEKTSSGLVRHKLIHSGMCQASDREREEALQRALESKWVKELQAEQRADGSWGRFHTQDSKTQQKCETTERAAWRLRSLGIGHGAAIVDTLCAYMETLLNDLSLWPDAWEKNKPFRPAVPLFIASKLSIFGSEDQQFQAIRDQWISILNAGFSQGIYSRESADARATELLGIEIQKTYIALNGINNLLLFSNHADRIAGDVQRAYLKWLHELGDSIQYTSVSLSLPQEALVGTARMQDYLWVLGMVSRLHGFREEFSVELDWLRSRQGGDGLWDFGPKLTGFRLSDNWRKDIDRKIDQTLHVLTIFQNAMR